VSDDVEDNAAAASRLSNDALARENFHLRDQLQDKDTVISSLQQRVHQLETQINELRQLPTGKISHIPNE
jgi:phage shock protein A